MELAKHDSYWFTDDNIANICRHYSAKYLGSWAILDKNKNWSEQPVEVFYVENPDKSKGHTHYFGIFQNHLGQVCICKADSAFSEPLIGLVEDGVVYISRYRHDYIETPKGNVIDGGRDYLRTNLLGKNGLVSVRVIKDSFVFENLQ